MLHRRQRAAPRRRSLHLEAVDAEAHDDELGDVLLVVDGQHHRLLNRFRHGPRSSLLRRAQR